MADQFLTLNKKAMDILKRPFGAQYHDFVRGFVYLAERAVCERVEQVDPAWSFEITDMRQRDTQIVVTATMTILGVSRQGVGMSDIKMIGKSPNEAEKGAATDALRRCARLFGVGRYLLDVPKSAKDVGGLTKWLNEISGDVPEQTDAPDPDPKQQPSNNKSKPAIPEGTTKQVTVVHREVTQKNDGKPMLKFKTSTGEAIFCFTRELFKTHGYCTGNDWTTIGETEDMNFTCNIVANDRGYWKFVDDHTFPDFDPGFELATRQQEMPGTPSPQWDRYIPM